MPKKADLLPVVMPRSAPQWLDRVWPTRCRAKPVRVDFYDIGYNKKGSLAAHQRGDGRARNLLRYLINWKIFKNPPAWLKRLPAVPLSEEAPDVVFYCPLDKKKQGHFHHLTRKVFFANENMLPDWRYTDWGLSYDAPGERNLYSNWHNSHPLPEELLEIAPPPASPAAVLAGKTKFCAFVYSEVSSASRIHLFEFLSRTMRVEAAGHVMRNVRGLPPRFTHEFVTTAIEFYRPYKFVIAFEHVRAPGYASEKIWMAFRTNAVPIYLGDPKITAQYNPEAFIHARDFDSLESLATYVMRVHADDALYLRYLAQPRLTEAQRARWQTYPEDCAAFLRKALFTPPVGTHAPRAQRDGFLRETISRLESEMSTRLLAAPHLDFRPGAVEGELAHQKHRVWQGETP